MNILTQRPNIVKTAPIKIPTFNPYSSKTQFEGKFSGINTIMYTNEAKFNVKFEISNAYIVTVAIGEKVIQAIALLILTIIYKIITIHL